MKSIYYLLLSLPILFALNSVDSSQRSLLQKSKNDYFAASLNDFETKCQKMMAILKGTYTKEQDAEYHKDLDEFGAALETALNANPTFEQLGKLNIGKTTFTMAQRNAEKTFYANAAKAQQDEEAFQKTLSEYQEEADHISSMLKDFKDSEDKAPKFTAACNDFKGRINTAKTSLTLTNKNRVEKFVAEIDQTFTELLAEYQTKKAEVNSQTGSATDEQKKTEKLNAASEGLQAKTGKDRINAELARDAALKKAVETALVSSMPPEFCWRGNNPDCPTAYPGRSGLLCYKDCEEAKQTKIAEFKTQGKEGKAQKLGRKKFNLWGGVCWEQCNEYKSDLNPPEKYKNIGLVCRSTEHWYHWHTKRSFVTSSVTNYNEGAVCPPDAKGVVHPKSWFMGLCYRSCEEFGFINCGAGACAIDKASCVKEIANIVVGTLIGITEVVFFGLSLGTSGALKEAVHAADIIAKQVINTAETLTEIIPKLADRYEVIEKVFKNEALKANVLKDCKSKARILLEHFSDITQDQINTACTNRANEQAEEAKKKREDINNLKIEVSAATFLQLTEAVVIEKLAAFEYIPDVKALKSVYGMFKDCKHLYEAGKTASENDKIKCAKNGLEVISGFDPTGIVGLAKTFVYPSCRSGLLDAANSVTYQKTLVTY